MKTPQDLKSLQALVSELFPFGAVETDNYGQLVIYTGLVADIDDCLESFLTLQVEHEGDEAEPDDGI